MNNDTNNEIKEINHSVTNLMEFQDTVSYLNSIKSSEIHNIYLKNGIYSDNRFTINNSFLNLNIYGNESLFNHCAFTVGCNTHIVFNNIIFDNSTHDYHPVIENDGDIIIDNCSFINNVEENFGTCISNNGHFSVNNSIFINNSGTYGGLFHNFNENTHTYITNSIFYNNSASDGTIIYTSSNVSLYNNTFSNLLAEDSCIAYSTGGVTNISNNIISNCSSHFAFIGGCYHDDRYTKIIVENNTIENCYANISGICTKDNAILANNNISNVYCGYYFIFTPGGSIKTNESTIIKNNHILNSTFDDAFIDNGEGLYNIINNTYEENNGSFIRNNAESTLEGNIIKNNRDKFTIIRNDISLLYWNETEIEEMFGTIEIINNTISDNNVSYYGTIMNAANMTLKNNIIRNNYADNNGGAINNMGNLTLEDNIFENNTSENGGAIYNLENINATNNTFTQNNATMGGCTYNLGNITFENNTFENNDAESGKVIENMVGATAEFEDNLILDDDVIANSSTSNFADNFEVNDKSLKTSIKTIKNSDNANSNLDNVNFNEITSNSRKDPLVVNDPKRGITFILKNYGNITLKNSNFSNIIEDPNNNLYSSLGNITIINSSFMNKKLDTKIVVDNVKSRIGDNMTLTAHVVDSNNNRVQSGSVIFKVNCLTLKSDKVFGSKSNTLQVNVVNGVASVNITSYLFLRNAQNLTAKYIGNNIYNSNSTTHAATMAIQLRNASLAVTCAKVANQDSNLLLTARVYDKNTNSVVREYDDNYVIFKVNGITIKDNKNNALKAKELME